jgi:hypothetical protein
MDLAPLMGSNLYTTLFLPGNLLCILLCTMCMCLSQPVVAVDNIGHGSSMLGLFSYASLMCLLDVPMFGSMLWLLLCVSHG